MCLFFVPKMKLFSGFPSWASFRQLMALFFIYLFFCLYRVQDFFLSFTTKTRGFCSWFLISWDWSGIRTYGEYTPMGNVQSLRCLFCCIAFRATSTSNSSDMFLYFYFSKCITRRSGKKLRGCENNEQNISERSLGSRWKSPFSHFRSIREFDGEPFRNSNCRKNEYPVLRSTISQIFGNLDFSRSHLRAIISNYPRVNSFHTFFQPFPLISAYLGLSSILPKLYYLLFFFVLRTLYRCS